MQQEPGCVTGGAASELVRQGPPSTWHRSTQPTNHPPTCSGRLASAATTTSTGTSSTGEPQIVLKVHRSNAPPLEHNGPHPTLLGASVAPHSCDMSVSPPRQSQNPPFMPATACFTTPPLGRLLSSLVWMARLPGRHTWTVPYMEQRSLRLSSFFSSDTRRSVARSSLGL